MTLIVLHPWTTKKRIGTLGGDERKGDSNSADLAVERQTADRRSGADGRAEGGVSRWWRRTGAGAADPVSIAFEDFRRLRSAVSTVSGDRRDPFGPRSWPLRMRRQGRSGAVRRPPRRLCNPCPAAVRSSSNPCPATGASRARKAGGALGALLKTTPAQRPPASVRAAFSRAAAVRSPRSLETTSTLASTSGAMAVEAWERASAGASTTTQSAVRPQGVPVAGRVQDAHVLARLQRLAPEAGDPEALLPHRIGVQIARVRPGAAVHALQLGVHAEEAGLVGAGAGGLAQPSVARRVGAQGRRDAPLGTRPAPPATRPAGPRPPRNGRTPAPRWTRPPRSRPPRTAARARGPPGTAVSRPISSAISDDISTMADSPADWAQHRRKAPPGARSAQARAGRKPGEASTGSPSERSAKAAVVHGRAASEPGAGLRRGPRSGPAPGAAPITGFLRARAGGGREGSARSPARRHRPGWRRWTAGPGSPAGRCSSALTLADSRSRSRVRASYWLCRSFSFWRRAVTWANSPAQGSLASAQRRGLGLETGCAPSAGSGTPG